MNQQIMIVDDFYDIAHKYHKSFFDDNCLITEETVDKISYLLGNKVEVINAFNETIIENTKNNITANFQSDWIAVIYLTMPSECVFKTGISFYTHIKTKLDYFPDDYTKELLGISSMEDIVKTFDVEIKEDWKKYSDIFVKYNRLVLFRANYWHSYGEGFGNNLNNSMIYQKVLLKNV